MSPKASNPRKGTETDNPAQGMDRKGDSPKASNPRKGTETLGRYPTGLFCIYGPKASNPRKGTETDNIIIPPFSGIPVRKHLIPERGRKLGASSA